LLEICWYSWKDAVKTLCMLYEVLRTDPYFQVELQGWGRPQLIKSPIGYSGMVHKGNRRQTDPCHFVTTDKELELTSRNRQHTIRLPLSGSLSCFIYFKTIRYCTKRDELILDSSSAVAFHAVVERSARDYAPSAPPRRDPSLESVARIRPNTIRRFASRGVRNCWSRSWSRRKIPVGRQDV
jgi:hypothetical protein